MKQEMKNILARIQKKTFLQRAESRHTGHISLGLCLALSFIYKVNDKAKKHYTYSSY